MSSPTAQKSLISDYFEAIWNRGELDREAEFVAADCIVHAAPMPGIPSGIEGPPALVKTLRGALPDLRLTNVLLFSMGDRVIQRFVVQGTHTGDALFGVPAAGDPLVLTGINEFRIADGKIAERWGIMDALGMLQQLGVVPDPMNSPPPDDAGETETRAVGDYQISAEETNLGERSHGEFLAQGAAGVVDEIYSSDVVIYARSIPPQWRHGTEGFKEYGAMLRTAFPDLQIVHDSVISEGHYLAFRWTFRGTHQGPLFGMPGTGKEASIQGYDIFRVENGVATELWVEQDMLGLMQQIGMAPAPA